MPGGVIMSLYYRQSSAPIKRRRPPGLRGRAQGKSVEQGKIVTEANALTTDPETPVYLRTWLDGRQEDGGAW
jgi:hypothetical protein